MPTHCTSASDAADCDNQEHQVVDVELRIVGPVHGEPPDEEFNPVGRRWRWCHFFHGERPAYRAISNIGSGECQGSGIVDQLEETERIVVDRPSRICSNEVERLPLKGERLPVITT